MPNENRGYRCHPDGRCGPNEADEATREVRSDPELLTFQTSVRIISTSRRSPSACSVSPFSNLLSQEVQRKLQSLRGR
jgi:hypothetical protein